MKPLVTITFCFAVIIPALPAQADDDLTQRLQQASAKLTQQTHLLRHSLKKGETITWKTVHRAVTETKVQGNIQTSKSRTIAYKTWRVSDVGENGEMTFTHTVDSVEMWQQVTGRQDLRYNSKTDKTPPPEFKAIPDSIGKPIAKFVADPSGHVISRESQRREFTLGMGNSLLPLPPKAVAIGAKWYSPLDVRTRTKEGQVKVVKCRKVYELTSVEDNIATISVDTEVLTPVAEPRIKVQLAQQLTKGEVRFDVAKGRLVEKEINWNEEVIGFGGADSSMRYLAQFTEEIQPVKTAAKDSETKR